MLRRISLGKYCWKIAINAGFTNKQFFKWIKDNFSTTYLFAQFSGASWYPLVYDYDEEKMFKLSKDKRVFKYKSITKLIDELNPNVYIPCAGPPCFLDEQSFDLNFED